MPCIYNVIIRERVLPCGRNRPRCFNVLTIKVRSFLYFLFVYQMCRDLVHMEFVDSIVRVMDLAIMCQMAPRFGWIGGEGLKDLRGLEGVEHGSRCNRGAHCLRAGLTKIFIRHVDFLWLIFT